MKKVKKVVKKTAKKETKTEQKTNLSKKGRENLESLMKRLNFKRRDVPRGMLFTVYIPTPTGRETLLSLGVNEEDGYVVFSITGKGLTKDIDPQTIRLATLKTSIFEENIELIEDYISKLNDALKI